MNKKILYIANVVCGTLLPLESFATTCPNGTTLNSTCWKCGSDCYGYIQDKTLYIIGNGIFDTNSKTYGKSYYNDYYPKWRDASYNSVIIQGKTSGGTGITTISANAFHGVANLQSITIPNSVTSIGDNAFFQARPLQSISIPSSVKTIGDAAFAHATGLKNVSLHSGLVSIGISAFYGASNLENITIPNSVTQIGSSAFENATALTSINIPDSVNSIESGTFRRCTNLQSVVLGSGIKSIGSEAFNGASNLKSINIPDSVTSIGTHAFKNASSLTALIIPDSVTTISQSAFDGVNLSDLTTSAENLKKYFSALGGLKAGADGKINITCTSGDCETFLKNKYKNNTAMLKALGFLPSSTEAASDDNTTDGGNGSNTNENEDQHSGNEISENSAPTDIMDNSETSSQKSADQPMAEGNRRIKRIYTVEEAARVSKPTGNTFMLRYK
ncbi:MAG: leucine-rich repeat protein [Alphaproteobacteria bacterium]|nr:leucine-rich repeat protein [Alphaproteobacteria bacterium]